MTRRELEIENARQRAALAGLDAVLRTVEGLGHYSADALDRLVQSFADDRDVQIRVADAVGDLSLAWAKMAHEMSRALTATKH